MLSVLRALKQNIPVAIIGMGAMGKGLFYQCSITPGINCVAIADIRLDRAVACVREMSLNYRIVENTLAADEAIRLGIVAVCEDGDLLARCDSVKALVESSSSVLAAGQFSYNALTHGKHLVLMNAEVDLIFGPYLIDVARQHGVAYTSCDGDQHGVIKHLADDLRLWGFDLVMAGNIKGYLDRYANPTTIIPEADKRELDYKMATAYTDGTKLCIEMALLANALGLSTDVSGMHGPRAGHVRDVFALFELDALWKKGVPLVDYVLGAEPDGGVFAIGYCNNAYQKKMLKYYKMGEGPFYLFYRPYHLCHIEAMSSVAKACLYRESLLEPVSGFRTNVFSYAKRDLHKGETLDGIGGYTCYGLIENCMNDGMPAGLPVCLAEGVRVKRDIAKDEKIFLDDIAYDAARSDFDMYSKALKLPSSLIS